MDAMYRLFNDQQKQIASFAQQTGEVAGSKRGLKQEKKGLVKHPIITARKTNMVRWGTPLLLLVCSPVGITQSDGKRNTNLTGPLKITKMAPSVSETHAKSS
jgi:hypothetical protein